MRIIKRISELQIPRSGKVGLVPTMGALHEGHLQLMRQARKECGYVVVSIFVNPLQFGPNEDFSKYPRDLQSDAEMAESVGVDLVFAPEVEEIYDSEPGTTVQVPGITTSWEGEHRPGHFDGVTIVVAKLFNIVQPNLAFFGRKDFQQCAVISRMVRDLKFALELRIEPTVREVDGLAMSSRNRYLSKSERAVAPLIYQVLRDIQGAILEGGDVVSVITKGKDRLANAGFQIDYLALVDDYSLREIHCLQVGSSLIFAGRLGKTRLIDNIAVA